jgi:hypothetical protein
MGFDFAQSHPPQFGQSRDAAQPTYLRCRVNQYLVCRWVEDPTGGG